LVWKLAVVHISGQGNYEANDDHNAWHLAFSHGLGRWLPFPKKEKPPRWVVHKMSTNGCGRFSGLKPSVSRTSAYGTACVKTLN
jgi:hypothetical protein